MHVIARGQVDEEKSKGDTRCWALEAHREDLTRNALKENE
jgi:hypothetical protein